MYSVHKWGSPTDFGELDHLFLGSSEKCEIRVLGS